MGESSNPNETIKTLQDALGAELSPGASITADAPSRWSAFGTPKAVATVHVNSEDDVARTVQYCNSKNLTFQVQGGGNGWAEFPSADNLILINLRNLNTITVADDKKSAFIQGGACVKETINAADAAGVILLTGNCNCVGTIGAILGGGYGNMMGMVGFGVDSILSLNVVTADGIPRTISATQEPDLFWAMKGAGANFAIVTSATVKAHAFPQDKRVAWSGLLAFTPDKLEAVVETVASIELSEKMVCFMYFSGTGPPAHTPMILVTPWLFQGTPETGAEAFKPLFDLGPVMQQTGVVPYPEWNTAADIFCEHAKRKPGFGAGLDTLDPAAWREIWDVFTEFQKKPGAESTAVLLERYPLTDVRLGDESSAAFPHRKVPFKTAAIPWYESAEYDEEALVVGKKIRDLLYGSDSKSRRTTYINFAHGDEPLDEIYGDSLPRLRELKKKWDPDNRFCLWFNIR